MSDDGTQTSYTYVDYKFYNNILCNSGLVTLYTEFSCENIGNNTIYVQFIVNDRNGSKIGSVTPVTKQGYTNGEIFSQYNIFDLSQYKLNDPIGVFTVRIQIGDSTTNGSFSNFKLLSLSATDGINYGVDVAGKNIGYNESKMLFTKM